MASNRPTSVRPATGLSQSNQEYIDDLEDSLILKQTLYASLTEGDNIPKTDEVSGQLVELKRDISRIEEELAGARASQSRASVQRHTSISANMDPFDDPRLGGAPWQDRKRSFGSSYLNGAATGRSEAKSRKPTPTPSRPSSRSNPFSVDEWDDIPCIDLTGVDDDEGLEKVFGKEVLAQQRTALERVERNKRDEEFARQLQQQAGPSSSAYTSNAQSASSQTGSPFSQASNRGLPILSAGRAAQHYQHPNASAGPSFVQGAGSVPWARNIDRPGPGIGSRSTAGLGAGQLPSMLQGHPSFSNSGPSTSPAKAGGSAFGNGFGPHRMPGTFDSSDEDDQDPQSSQFSRTGSLGLPPFYATGPPTTIEQSRQAALSLNNQPQYLSGLQSYGTSHLASQFGQPQGLSAFPVLDRPGFLNGGSYLSQHGINAPSLGSIINRHNTYDFTNFTDSEGNPLPDMFRARMQELQDFVEDPRKTSEEIRNLLANIRPDMEIPVEERGETPDGLKYPLYTHQQLALTWMTNMEKGTNKGGILADDMGLGKTISALSLMVSRKSDDDKNKTNLIIGPVALITQWQSEIKKKIRSSSRLSCYNLKKSKKLSFQQMCTYDVVLTTYGSIAAEWKRYEEHVARMQGAEYYEAARDKDLLKKCPILHPTSRFFRIFLDEAQCIKNASTQSSRGCAQITATYRWCLTGTPIMNGVTELYPLIRFLRIKPYSNQKLFSKDFKSLTAKPGRQTRYDTDESMRKLQAVLKAIMLRRTKSTMIDGKPILELKPKIHQDENVVFSDDESKFYIDLEASSQVQLNKYLRAGTVGKNYSNILVLLLRLRQACCHPHLIDYECVGTSEVSEDLMIGLAKTLESNVVDRIKAIGVFECPICYDAVDDPTLIYPCGHDTCTECFASLTANAANDNIRTGNENGLAKCPVCRGAVDTKKVIKYSAFVSVHMPEKAPPRLDQADNNLDDDDDDDISSESDSEVDDDTESLASLEDFIVPDGDVDSEDENDAEIDAELAAAAAERKAKRAEKKKAKQAKKKDPKPAKLKKPKPAKVEVHQLASLRHEAGKSIEARRRYMHYLRDNWLDSAKVSRIIDLLAEIQQQTKGEKTIIFSQWTSLLDLIECQVKYKLRLKYSRYTGGMSTTQRDKAVDDFVNDPYNTVMLVSLRAGNAGLNLTVANHVIIADPFWNPFIENQAVDRAHRIGQQREVKIHRILIKDTVEDRIIALQEKKRELVESALDEGQARNLGRLGETELRYLFGVS